MANSVLRCLDVGAIEYGDAVLYRRGGKTILIDGGKTKSAQTTTSVVLGDDISHKPLDQQIRELLNQQKAHVDLLVITHCHSDHIGCLPELLNEDRLTCDWALVADPQLGYGITEDNDDVPAVGEMSDETKLWLALREEPLFDATDLEIAELIADSAQEFQAYLALVEGLGNNLGNRCVVYRGPTEALSPGLDALLAEFSGTGLKIYGPSEEHLLLCAAELEGRDQDLIADAIDSSPSLVEAYRSIVESLDAADQEDSADGNAVNCQSIVMAVGGSTDRVLLTGDMQFAQTNLSAAITAEVEALLNATLADAPFACVKLSHHGATNGQNKSIIEQWGAKKLIISTGSKSTKHPTKPTLDALEALESDGFDWARVDMNGICTFRKQGSTLTLDADRLNLNDKTLASERTGDEPGGALVAATQPTVTTTAGSVEVNVAAGGSRTQVSVQGSRVVVTIDLTDGDSRRPLEQPASERGRADVGRLSLGGGRSAGSGLPRLLFVTDPQELQRRILAAGINQLEQALARAGQPLLEGPGADLLGLVNRRITSDRTIEGVVLVGGFDVVPSQIVNTLPLELAGRRVADRDRLQVWSDDGYGDFDGNGVPELPVSRVPDGGTAEFLFRCLGVGAVAAPRQGSGIRNMRRPFADKVFSILGNRKLSVCDTTPPAARPFDVAGDCVYYMLHGMSSNTAEFVGEDDGGEYPLAINTAAIPSAAPAVVFAGCCYGALIADQIARDAAPGTRVQPRPPSESIALTYLARGANSFVGCTGVHYSPTKGNLDYFGEPMHRYFMRELIGGSPPSRALFRAKHAYGRGIPHRSGARPEEIAYEHKILRQFTCLGLGW
jgi:beta-lactamase superfamily II metal-dependent hydrolase